MQGIGVVLSTLAAGCGFQLSGSSGATDHDAQPGPGIDAPTTADAPLPIDAPPADTAPAPRKLYAASDTRLYQIDVDAHTATLVGTIQMGATTFDVDGLAFDGTNLLGLSPGATELLIIDPDTAAVTARRTISPAGTYGGLTVAPAGEAGPTAVVFAGSGSKLVRLDPATGVATQVGSFGYWGGTLSFFSDLAWVSGAGLHVTLEGGYCSPRCIAKINHTTGLSQTPFRDDLAGDVFGLSGYRGQLWALDHAGPVQSVNPTTGALTTAFDPAIAWTEAAQ